MFAEFSANFRRNFGEFRQSSATFGDASKMLRRKFAEPLPEQISTGILTVIGVLSPIIGEKLPKNCRNLPKNRQNINEISVIFLI